MSESLFTWDDGNKKWSRSNNNPSHPTGIEIELSYGNAITTTLVGCNIQSDIVGESFVVIKNDIVLKHFEITAVISFFIKDNIMTIETKDYNPIKLYFSSTLQAQKGENRLYMIMNGFPIYNCDDEHMFQCGDLKNLNVSF